MPGIAVTAANKGVLALQALPVTVPFSSEDPCTLNFLEKKNAVKFSSFEDKISY